jgi:hypothetical protein
MKESQRALPASLVVTQSFDMNVCLLREFTKVKPSICSPLESIYTLYLGTESKAARRLRIRGVGMLLFTSRFTN